MLSNIPQANVSWLLVIYPIITFTHESEQQSFLHLAQGGSISISDLRLPIREATIQDQHPYLILPYNTEIQQMLIEYDRLLEQSLRRAQVAQNAYFTPEALLKEAFLATFLSGVGTGRDVPPVPNVEPLPLFNGQMHIDQIEFEPSPVPNVEHCHR